MLRACHQEKNHYWMILNQNSEHTGGGYVFSICSNPAGVKYTENCPLNVASQYTLRASSKICLATEGVM